LADVIYRDIALRGFFILNWLRDTPRERLHRLYGELSQLVGEGAIHAEIEATYPLERYSEALLHAAKNSRNGKILFIPNGEQALESGPALSGSYAGRERSS
jgi:NADPH:quinone reductase-like Zn-dependent oxidoreductase